MTTYRITYADGSTQTEHASIHAALGEISRFYPGLDHETTEGRTLIWASSADAENDDGSRAVAEIRRIQP